MAKVGRKPTVPPEFVRPERRLLPSTRQTCPYCTEMLVEEACNADRGHEDNCNRNRCNLITCPGCQKEWRRVRYYYYLVKGDLE